MAGLREVTSYSREFEILDGCMGLNCPVHATVSAALISAKADGTKTYGPGFFLSGTSAAARLLPRSVTKTLITGSSSTTVSVKNPQVFVPTDVVKVLAPSNTIDIADTWAASDTLAVQLDDGVSVTHTSTTATIATLATEAAATFNSSTLGKYLTFVAGATYIFVYAKDFATQHKLTITATTAGDGSATIDAGASASLASDLAIGTVATGGVDVATGVITFASAASNTVPAGVPIGVDSTPLGLDIRSRDYGSGEEMYAGLANAANIKAGILPYWDGELASLFPKISYQEA